MSVKDILLEHIVPGAGAAVASCLFASPMKAVLKVRQT